MMPPAELSAVSNMTHKGCNVKLITKRIACKICASVATIGSFTSKNVDTRVSMRVGKILNNGVLTASEESQLHHELIRRFSPTQV